MLIAKRSDKKRCVEIIVESFKFNPSVNIVIGNSGNKEHKIRRLAKYGFEKSFNRGGVFISSNGKGTAYCFESNVGKSNIKEIWNEVLFAFSIPPKKIFETLKREKYIKTQRIKQTHLYFWFFGTVKGGGNAAFEIKDYLFNLSKEKNLPIILETSVRRNKMIYERYGFTVYHEWADSGDGNKLWFMKRDPSEF